MYQLSEEPFWAETFQAQLANLPAGAHLCQVYRTINEQLQCAVTFCRGGIRRNQQCLYFARPQRAQKLLRSMQATGQVINTVPGRFELVVKATRDIYERDGQFSPEAMLDYLQRQADQAKRAGFAGLRVAAQMDWVLLPDVPTEVFFAFEGPGLHDFTAATGTRFIGQFDRRQFRPEILLGVLRSHPLVVIGSYVLDNLYYEPPSLLRDNTSAAADRRVDWELSQLQERMRRVIALADLEHWALAGAAPEDLMEAAVHLVAFELKAGLADIFEVLPANNAFTRTASVGWRDWPTSGAGVWDAPAQTFLEREVRTGRPFIVPAWREEDRLTLPGAFKVNGVASSIIVAIGSSRDAPVLGFLGAHFRHPRVFSLGEVVYLEKVATALACALIQARGVDELRALVENAPDLIARFDSELRFVYINAALAAIADTSPPSLLGETMRESGMPESFASAWESVLRRAWRTGREQPAEFVLPTPQGERFFQARIVPETGRDGVVQSLLVMARDVTDLRQAEADRADLYREVTGLQERLAEVASLPRNLDQEMQRLVYAPQAEQLTKRERDILRLLTFGRTNRQISARTGLAFGTVKNYVSQLLTKLGVTDRTQAAVRAVELGLVRPADQH